MFRREAEATEELGGAPAIVPTVDPGLAAKDVPWHCRSLEGGRGNGSFARNDADHRNSRGPRGCSNADEPDLPDDPREAGPSTSRPERGHAGPRPRAAQGITTRPAVVTSRRSAGGDRRHPAARRGSAARKRRAQEAKHLSVKVRGCRGASSGCEAPQANRSPQPLCPPVVRALSPLVLRQRRRNEGMGRRPVRALAVLIERAVSGGRNRRR
jgi:hypothetical protein